MLSGAALIALAATAAITLTRVSAGPAAARPSALRSHRSRTAIAPSDASHLFGQDHSSTVPIRVHSHAKTH
jgi:hypothetical protein